MGPQDQWPAKKVEWEWEQCSLFSLSLCMNHATLFTWIGISATESDRSLQGDAFGVSWKTRTTKPRLVWKRKKTKYLQVVWIIGLCLKPERKSMITAHMRRLSIKRNINCNLGVFNLRVFKRHIKCTISNGTLFHSNLSLPIRPGSV